MHCPTLALGLTGVAAASVAFAQIWVEQSSGTTASLRGVSVVSPAVVWASGAGGTYLRTLDGGATWHAAVVPGEADPDFRSVHALDSHTAWLMSSGAGAKSRIYRTADDGAHWSLLNTNPDAGGFFDALAFWDARRGVVLGDPVDGTFVILTTGDGGQTWQRRKLPPSLLNEGAFAASNSSLRVRGKRDLWFGTGGPQALACFIPTTAAGIGMLPERRFATMAPALESSRWHSRTPCTGWPSAEITASPPTPSATWPSPRMAGARGTRPAARLRTATVPQWLFLPAARSGSLWGHPVPIFRATEAKAGSRSIAALTTLSAPPGAMPFGQWALEAASAACNGNDPGSETPCLPCGAGTLPNATKRLF